MRLILTLAFTLLACAPATAAGPKLLVCLGDSITAGYGLSEEEAWPALLQKKLPDWKLVNAGVSGDTSAGGLKRLDWILKSHPAAVFVGLGGNDGLRGIKPTETERNLVLIMEKIKASGARPFLAGMMVPTNYGEEYFFDVKVLYPRVAKRCGVDLYPFLLEGVAGKAALNQSDGIHPTAEGQAVLAERLGRFLAPRLKRIQAPKSGGPSAPAKVIRSRKDL